MGDLKSKIPSTMLNLPADAWCCVCGDVIQRGAEGRWVRGVGMFHPTCYEGWDADTDEHAVQEYGNPDD